MGTPVYMTLKEACEIVQNYADIHTGGDILAGISEMRACYDDLDREDQVASTMFVNAGRKMMEAI
jgi:hypothetical protein